MSMQQFTRLTPDEVTGRLSSSYGNKAHPEACVIVAIIKAATGHEYVQATALDNFLTRLDKAKQLPSEAKDIQVCGKQFHVLDVPTYNCTTREKIWEKFPGIQFDYNTFHACSDAIDLLVSEHKGMDHAHNRLKGGFARSYKMAAYMTANQTLGHGWRKREAEFATRLEEALPKDLSKIFANRQMDAAVWRGISSGAFYDGQDVVIDTIGASGPTFNRR